MVKSHKKYTDQRLDEFSRLVSANQDNLRQNIKYEREIRQLTEQHVADALALQAKENERRLAGLNNEYGRIDKVLAGTIPRETWENGKEEQNKFNIAVTEKFAEIRGERKKTNFLMTVGLFLVAILSFSVDLYNQPRSTVPMQVINPASHPVPTQEIK